MSAKKGGGSMVCRDVHQKRCFLNASSLNQAAVGAIWFYKKGTIYMSNNDNTIYFSLRSAQPQLILAFRAEH